MSAPIDERDVLAVAPVATPAATSVGVAGTIAAFVALTKPRIGGFVLFAAFVGGLLAAGPGADVLHVLEAAFWITCAAASASLFNQVLERDLDARMVRTRLRPLPSGRVGTRDAILFGAALTVASTLGLALRFELLAALLALLTTLLYVAVYTPLKRVSSLNTVVGAIPGAAPPLLGAVALSGTPGRWGWILFAIVFAWQFPHFMAIAWLHRADYARAGMRMLPSLPDTAGLAGRQALLHALVLLPVSLLPGVQGDAGIVYTAGALLLGLVYVGASARFAARECAPRARALMIVSLVHLPLLLSLPLLDPVVRVALAMR